MDRILALLALLALGTTGCSRARSNVQSRQTCRTGFVPMPVCRRPGFGSWRPVASSHFPAMLSATTSVAATVQDASQVKDVRLVIDNLRVVEAHLRNSSLTKPSLRVRLSQRKNRRLGSLDWDHSIGEVERRPASSANRSQG